MDCTSNLATVLVAGFGTFHSTNMKIKFNLNIYAYLKLCLSRDTQPQKWILLGPCG